MGPSPDQTIFHLKHRRHMLVEGAFFLMFGGSAAVRAYVRFGQEYSGIWNAWWFFAILAAIFAYFFVESIYKYFFNRLVLTPEGLSYYGFLK